MHVDGEAQREEGGHLRLYHLRSRNQEAKTTDEVGELEQEPMREQMTTMITEYQRNVNKIVDKIIHQMKIEEKK